MVRFPDRTGRPHVLNMTHEEVVVTVAEAQIESYRQLPTTLYQIQTKFRDEPRSRGGLLRVREFTMKDAYSFHRDQACLDATYQAQHQAYSRIFARCGLKEVVDIRSDTGMMGGAVAHEFMLLHEVGEDSLLLCEGCDYRANREVAQTRWETLTSANPAKRVEVETPSCKTIEEVAAFLKLPPTRCVKAVAFVADETRKVLVFLRGDLEVEEAKLRSSLKAQGLRPMEESEIRACGAIPGYIGPHELRDVEVLLDKSLAEGEDLVCGANREGFHLTGFSLSRDLPQRDAYRLVEVAAVRDGDPCPDCSATLKMSRGVEVGNIFQLGTHYSAAMGMTYLEEDGSSQSPLMGCYGIGVERTFAVQIEESHDQYGPLFPMSIAPYQVQVVVVGAKKEALREAGESLYRDLQAAGIEVLLDTRKIGFGAMMADADLIGAPLRLVVSKRNLDAGEIEVRVRTSGPSEGLPNRIPLEGAASKVASLVEQLLKPYRFRKNP
jgi:prolyl-tRNA synthetase